MEQSTAKKANELTKRFYEIHARSFSETRQSKWNGWDSLESIAGINFDKLDSVLDIACGNMRFLKYLSSKRTNPNLSYYGIDCTQDLLDAANDEIMVEERAQCQNADIIEMLLSAESPIKAAENIGAPSVDLVVIFGFMHHIPTYDAALRLLELANCKIGPDGYLAASFWQPLNDERIRNKAERITSDVAKSEGIVLDMNSGDAFLDWQNNNDAFRFCHQFSESEIDDLSKHMEQLGCEEACRYYADGKSGRLNRYVVWKRR